MNVEGACVVEKLLIQFPVTLIKSVQKVLTFD